jgi:hypothetical protein
MKPANTICGRKFCPRCGRWRLGVDFYVREWSGDTAYKLQTRCATCQRVSRREADGFKPRRWGACHRGHPRTPDNLGTVTDANGYTHRYCKPCRRQDYERRRAEREWVERRREYQRFWMERKRRSLGVPERRWGSRSNRAPDTESAPLLDARPFIRWLQGKRDRHETIVDMAIVLGIDDSLLGKLLAEQKASVLLTTVDRVLTREGSTFLWELYPSTDERLAA